MISKNNLTPQQELVKAIHEHRFGNVKAAIAHGADPNANDICYVSDRDGNTYNHATPLLIAIEAGSPEIAQWLVNEHNADPVALIDYRTTPLHQAVQYNYSQLIGDMAGKKIDLDFEIDGGETPLLRAISSSRLTGMRQLLSLGASPNAGSTVLPLFSLNENSNAGAYAKALIEAGADMHARQRNGISFYNAAYIDIQNIIDEKRNDVDAFLRAQPGSGMPRERLIGDDGALKPAMYQILSAKRLPQLFSAQRWQGKEVQAIELFETLSPLVPPYYRPMLDSLDLTDLHEKAIAHQPLAESAVVRYTRRQVPKGRQP